MTRPANSRPPSPPPPKAKPDDAPEPPARRWFVAVAGLAVLLTLFTFVDVNPTERDELSYSEFLAEVDAGQIESVEVRPSGAVLGARVDESEFETRIPVDLAGDGLLERLEQHGVTVSAAEDSTGVFSQLLTWIFALAPVLLLIGFWVYLGRRAGGALGGVLGMGRSKARVADAERPSTTFADVAGYESVKAEIGEIVEFLREPDRFAKAGAVAPRGVLMTGPPGTGKTLIARAVAGEADVPFLSVTGSAFVEMFVGVGAARVRDLFEDARKRAPAIIFVDEIDAIGQRRSGNVMTSNDEREQTLNQLLAEMDGFDPAEGIIVLAATNRPEVLDAALLRPGRFDRQVVIPLPNQDERAQILAVHSRGKQLAPDVDLDVLARGTPGFSGADLANLANEAAIRAARAGRTELTATDFDNARDRVLLGQRDGSNVLLPEERRAVAVHEAGHAIVAALSVAADPVHKVTILPAGLALGATHQLPLHERHLYSERYLYDTIDVQLGGRAAELAVFGEASTGAANDLANATQIATKMVREYGLSTSIGPVGYPSGGPMFLPGGTEMHSRQYAEATQREIDVEVARLLAEAEARAVAAVAGHRDALERIVELLLEHETVEGETVYEILGRPFPTHSRQVLGESEGRPPRTGSAGDVGPWSGERSGPTLVPEPVNLHGREALVSLTPQDSDAQPRLEVSVFEDGALVTTEVFAELEEAEAFAEQWTEQSPGAHIEIEDRTHDHTAWELVADDTAPVEDYPRAEPTD